MENLSDDQSVIMEEIDPQNITDEQKCNNLKSIDKQIKIFTARKDYIRTMLNIEKSITGPTNETSQKLEVEAAGLDEIRALEALNNANDDVEDVTPAVPKVKPVMMKLSPEHTLLPPIPISVVILRSKQNLPTTIEKLLNSSLTRKFSTTLLTSPQIDHSNWSLKASWPPPIPKKLKRTLLIKVSKLKKSRSCANLKPKVPFPSS
ncbi:hypothetical protein TNCV_3273201 [Trichonephila clavipes]|nr:hypothetical protein TNCV_3273201 [Trichonephila clavipes]